MTQLMILMMLSEVYGELLYKMWFCPNWFNPIAYVVGSPHVETQLEGVCLKK